MLMPVQTSGSKAPLFFVHGISAVMPLGPMLAQALGQEQPVYATHADGIDGRRPVIDNLKDMALAYAEEIQVARPDGAIMLGGMCEGSSAAIEITRTLQEKGRQIDLTILLDPPPLPPGFRPENQSLDTSDPPVRDRLYREARRALSEEDSDYPLPFDGTDPHQVHLATLAAVGSLLAFARHVPTPFSGPVISLLSAEHAPGFFHPQMPWSHLLPQLRMAHVLPYYHRELLRSGRERVGRVLRFMLEQVAAGPAAPAEPAEPAVA